MFDFAKAIRQVFAVLFRLLTFYYLEGPQADLLEKEWRSGSNQKKHSRVNSMSRDQCRNAIGK